MASSESDDEPLAALAAIKKLNPSEFGNYYPETTSSAKPPKHREKKRRLPLTIEIKTVSKNLSPTVIERPDDVWLYLKDFNQAGPYSCLLCSEWFINRSKIIVHYVLTHKKDFCGICRYFVPNRESWIEHQKFHVPWQCSQCISNFDTEAELRAHFSTVHKLVHCRLCCFRIPDNDQYNRHLYERHNVTNVSNKNEPTLWELEYEGCPKFLCLLCSKSNNLSTNYFNHYMCHHRITLKCFASLISGTDPPFSITGACISTEFLESQLKQQPNYGYMDIELKPPADIIDNPEKSKTITNFTTLIPEVKQECMSDQENELSGNETISTYIKSEKRHYPPLPDDGPWNTYKGDEDFDITSTELFLLQQCYFEYMNNTFCDINSNIMPKNSEIVYDIHKYDIIKDIDCPICEVNHKTVSEFNSHITKMHGVKIIPSYSCRVCAANFDTQSELCNHVTEELKDFEDLWICQFCDQEFDTREATRRHLTEHWSSIEMDNCFSPHLGFKCKYCPTLFWNEIDRETHQNRVHFPMHKEDYYRCEPCGDIFSDKIWFTYHYIQNHYQHDEEATNPSFLFKCSLCCIVLNNVETLRRHFADKHGEARKIFCSFDNCKHKPFAQRKSFKIHLKVMHNPLARPPGTVRCGACSREFSTARAAAAHAALAHGAARFKCKLCERALATQDERKLHYLLSHPGRHPFECSVCGKSFPYKSSLYTHRAEHKNTQAASYTCTYCGKVFTKKDSYREHVQIHTGPRHACSYCPMRFVQRSNMLRHERRHTGERPFTCRHCSRQFADQGACRSHERTHSKERSFPCLYCGQCFVQKSKLTYHIRRHTGQDLETCSICSKLFTSACSLREHMKTHNKSEQVPCPLCDRRYQDSRYMLRHLRTAHSRAAHTCPVAQCGKRLTSQVGLRQHVLTHSKLKLYQCKSCPKAFACKRSMYTHLRGRHHININFGERNIREYCTTLDARECELGLSEETLTKVFGPPKSATDVLLKQGISLMDQPVTSRTPESEEASRSGEVSDNSVEKENIKKEPESDGELEPTDFVTVKIEPIGDDNESE